MFTYTLGQVVKYIDDANSSILLLNPGQAELRY